MVKDIPNTFIWSGWIKPVVQKQTDYICMGFNSETGKVTTWYQDKYGNKTNEKTA